MEGVRTSLDQVVRSTKIVDLGLKHFSQCSLELSERATLRRRISATDRAIGFKFGRIVPRGEGGIDSQL